MLHLAGSPSRAKIKGPLGLQELHLRRCRLPIAVPVRDGEKIDFFDFSWIGLALSIIDKKLHLCPELQKSQ